jgi:cyclase
VVPLRGNLTMLVMEPAGNALVSAGDDGVILIDDQFAPMSPRIHDAVAELSDQPVSYLFNTHWHGRHRPRPRRCLDAFLPEPDMPT